MDTPIYDMLLNMKNSNIYPFHMPGHKRNKLFMPPDMLNMDITEVEGADSLHNPKGVIKKSLENLSKVFGADYSFISVNGSSGGIISAILSCCCEGDKIIVPVNCHKSVYSAIILSGAFPVYIEPEYFGYGIWGEVNAENVKNAIIKNSDVKAVVITSPTYEGICSDIKAISDICHERNIILIVDEAHGAHMVFNNYFPKTALMQEADISIQSLHKTLMTMTQTALVHIKGNRVDKERLFKCISMTMSTSPSYVFMGNIDYMLGMLNKSGKKIFSDYISELSKFRDKMKKLKNIFLIEKRNLDKSKLTFIMKKGNGINVSNFLFHEYGIMLEYVSKGYFIAMTSPADTKEGFERLEKGLFEADKKLCNEKDTEFVKSNFYLREYKLNMRDAFFKKSEKVNFNESVGKVSADFIIPYPPGIPVLTPGEVISKELIQYVNNLKSQNAEIIGINKGVISCVYNE